MNHGKALFEKLVMEYDEYITAETASRLASELQIEGFDVREYDV